jgi:hypothetical protein
MNATELDALIHDALHARADQLTEADLGAGLPPSGTGPRRLWAAPLLAAAVIAALAVGTTVAVRSATTGTVKPASPIHSSAQSAPMRPMVPLPSTAGGHPSTPTPAKAPASNAVSTPASTVTSSAFELGYQPLWPFGSYQQSLGWQHGNPGSQPWHLDAGQTALAFTRSYLGFTEIDRVISIEQDAAGAHVGVGYRNPAGTLATAAVLHLVRYGTGTGNPWEVVGSDDTTLLLETPDYGSTVSSPLVVGGHITGVDESIRLSARSLTGGLVSASVQSIPAGGERQPWHGTISFTGHGVLSLVASTGGHLQAVERFAVQGVHT